MELRHLRYFVAVAEELNFRKASELLRVAQPALSTQIRDLEDEVGVRLLDRDTGGVRLTEAGAAFLVESRLILAQAQQAITIAREAARGQRGHITVGYIGALMIGFMPAVLQRFSADYPDVDVALTEMTMSDQLAGLTRGEIDVGFVIKDVLPLPAGVQEIEVVRSQIGVIMGKNHRFAKKARLSLAEVAREPLICLSLKKGFAMHGDLLHRAFERRSLKHDPIRPVEGAETFRAMLESGLGLSLVSEVGSLPRSRYLVFKPLADTGEDLIMIVHAVWRLGDSSRIAGNFVEMVRAYNASEAAKPKSKSGRTKRD